MEKRETKKQKGESRGAKDRVNRAVMHTAYAVVLLFLVLMAYFAWFVALRAPEVIGSSYNPRIDLFAEHVIRGKILTADGQTAAETLVDADGNETRSYPYGALLAPVTGDTKKGRTGVESLANFTLLSSHVNVLEQLANELSGEKSMGDNVVLTLNLSLQQLASDALSDRRGAVVAMEPESGKILCMVSKPSYDPNTILEDWDQINAADNDKGQLLNRATQGAYPPGSTFKLVTLLSYVHAHPSDWQSFRYTCSGVYTDADGNSIRCYGQTAHGEQSLSEAFANSCNGAFAAIGASLSADELRKTAEELLYNQALPYALPSAKSRFRLEADDSAFVREQTAIGQGESMMSPLHNLLLAAAVANGGTIPKPYLLDHTENAAGEIVKRYEPEEYGRILSEEDAALLSGLMRLVVTEGTGSAFRDAPYEVFAKTGSAEYESGGSRKTHAWCIACAGEAGRRIAVCVLVEDGKSGGSTAAPIARKLTDAYLQN